ncbi:DNA repair protein [Streptomyces sp. 604F]|uniref:alpha-ketoglutarate-dependent dioxygenase AlkB family protein n=1 Tax=Streptomyces sp. 604F TaxID=1476754 RepID=UPI001398CF7C|nr:alpha-ketoglutarate-dependent dioxygenase AlkB [Streptomyces sp. 604F]MBP3076086.1 DNA repair protein [Streptomyces sp. 604F]QHV88654.1 alpha-ketoglutarate-dependent dioxygenase AlkB [Streptomyces sp. 604F]
MAALIPRSRTTPAPGAVHVPQWLSEGRQRELVEACRGWARGPVPMRHTELPGGGTMSVQSVSLGWHWSPYRYTRRAGDVNGAPVAPLPEWLVELGRRAVADAYQDEAAGRAYRPDVALVNFYGAGATMGMHQDQDERSDAPVVSLSVGDACLFRLGNTEGRGRPWQDLRLESGDLLVFGGPARFAYHGVPKVYPGTAEPSVGPATGRLNLTLRETGLPG